ncbi:arogenate dehydrogenase [Euphorbia peplus]|nr:arogenate dehydrogenase [Euphorbia peplus]
MLSLSLSLSFLHPTNPPLSPPLHFPRLRIGSISTASPEMAALNLPQISNSDHLRVALIGFSNSAQFISQTLISQGHTVLLDHLDFSHHNPQVILFCTSLTSAEETLKSLSLDLFNRGTLFVDVLPVKQFAKSLLLHTLPIDFDIVCCHPMIGHEGQGVDFVYEIVRVGVEESRVTRCKTFLDVFGRQGCRMVELGCEEYDKYAAGTLFVTYTVGRVLRILELESTPINTKGYESLLDLVKSTEGDGFEFYYGLFVFNKNAVEMLERLDLSFQALKKELFGSFHEDAGKQLFRVPNYVNGHPNTPFSSNDERYGGASQPYQYQVWTSDHIGNNSKIKIGIVGFGNFGQFLAKTFLQQGHTVLAYSRSDYSDVAQKMGVSYFYDVDHLCEEHPEVILLCTSILSTENVLKSLPVQRLKKNTLFVDVLSVKEFPRNLFLQHLLPDFDILCTHPMFGPESGKNGWNHLPFVFDKVRVGSDEMRQSRCDQFLDIFAREGCRMVEMSCAEHDRHAAGSQFVTHTVGRVLEKLRLEPTPINTKGYETLLNLVENTASDSFDLYYGLFMYNVNAMKQLERLESAFECLKKQLFGQLQDVLRKQLPENAEAQVSADEFSISESSLEAFNVQNN